MGGVKNREEKKKKAHVYSSGAGGGGTKGPPPVDKRTLDEPCPFCDRTFKQHDRLTAHIAKKHAESNIDGDAGAGPSSGEEAGGQPSTASTSATSNAPQKRTMEVGSRGGYFSEKSPKLLLHEWCLQQKRPKPRYKSLPDEAGGFRCKVVLADPRDHDRDVVAFLDRNQPADQDEEEAGQLAAITMLHKVAGDRSLHRVIPASYQPLWQQLSKQAEDRAERDRRRSAAAESRQAREKGKWHAEDRKKPVNVVMSDQQQAALEAALTADADEDDEDSWEEALEPGPAVDICEALEAKGFSHQDAARAVRACGASPSRTAALDWLLLHVKANRLPEAFAPGKEHRPIEVIKLDTAGSAAVSEAVLDQSAIDLASYGYCLSDCMEALHRSQNDANAALKVLYQALAGIANRLGDQQQRREVAMPAVDGAEASLDMFREEHQALEALYGSSRVSCSADRIKLQLPIPDVRSPCV
ncbi:hypothetical protein WJX84_005972 [Apatococcus fuscideae]|uniref:C2H2-type domain-containing protein n=1 Tax=Apatococcus fuscideae TaxID=2026836 RepID=A0AAW1TCP0_9CHLO